MDCRYNDLNAYLRKSYGCRVQKISLDAGLTCPNRDGSISNKGCIYCNERGSGTGRHSQGWTISRQMEEGIKALSKRYKAKKFIAYFQSFTNTYGNIKKLKSLYEEALSFKDVVGLSIGTRPDCINDDILNLLQAYANDYMVWIEYGLQSANDKTLSLINRGHDVDCFKRAVTMTRGKGIKICAHVILGLPGENKEDMMNTAKTLACLDIEGVKIHLMYVVKNTELERLYRLGKYFCFDQTQYVELVCDFLELLPGNMIIQRLTGDPRPGELVAPKWCLNKTETILLIRQMLEDRDSRQGKRFEI
jgi:radical SAM protein (TIGR01212 family)